MAAPTVHRRLVAFYARRLWRMDDVEGLLAPGAGTAASVERASVVFFSAGAFFCLAGMLNAFWCKHRAKQARRVARRLAGGSRSDELLRRSLPTDRSLLYQAATALATGVVAASGAG